MMTGRIRFATSRLEIKSSEGVDARLRLPQDSLYQFYLLDHIASGNSSISNGRVHPSHWSG